MKFVPLGIGCAGVMTSLVLPHCAPCEDALLLIGAQAGGFGLVALIGFARPVR